MTIIANYPMETKIFSDFIKEMPFQFMDLSSSHTVPCVFKELNNNIYGLEDIILTENDVVIDVGANVGMFSIYVKKKFNCKIIAFEPVPINFNHFLKNIGLNGLKVSDFELHNSAISSKEGDVLKIGVPTNNTGGSSSFHGNSSLAFDCPTETLFKYFSKDCKYLKMDCEGGEYEIIPSILKELNRFSYLGIEYHVFSGAKTLQDVSDLDKLIRENFEGKIFHNSY